MCACVGCGYPHPPGAVYPEVFDGAQPSAVRAAANVASTDVPPPLAVYASESANSQKLGTEIKGSLP